MGSKGLVTSRETYALDTRRTFDEAMNNGTIENGLPKRDKGYGSSLATRPKWVIINSLIRDPPRAAMDAKLAACLGYSVRLATRCGYMELLPHLQRALFTLVSGDAHVDSAADPEKSCKRRTISLFQALHPDGSDVPSAQYAQEVQLVGTPRRLLADAEAQTCEDIQACGQDSGSSEGICGGT